MVASESEMQEVFAAAGTKLVVVYFYNDINEPISKELLEIAKEYTGWLGLLGGQQRTVSKPCLDSPFIV